jgi:carboxyl-terminal processing protease
LVLAAAATAVAAPGPALKLADPKTDSKTDKATTQANITRLTTSLLAGSQFARHPLDDQMAAKLIERYLEALDGSRTLFLQSDVDEFARLRPSLAQSTRELGDTRAARIIFDRYLERLGQQAAYDTELLKAGAFEFAGKDSYTYDRKKSPRPKDLAAARELWRQELRAEYLQEKLIDKKPKHDEVAALLNRRHGRQLKTMKNLRDDEVLEIYLDALAHVYDPHSDYLGQEEMESFSIAMNLSLFGIGAALGSEDGVCVIRELVPGSPAAKSGMLNPGDRITAVQQEGAEPVDIADMRLGQIVNLIRGPKGTPVTLSVLPAVGVAGAPKTVRLIRAEIKLEDQQAKAQIIDLPPDSQGPFRVGVIDLPSFYTSGDRNGRGGMTVDVAKLITKLKAEKVRGIVLDLRRNGGGSLDEGIRLTGLFIKSGPVVQTRDFKNTIDVANDPDSGILYDGPLLVLTSRFSASASEIVAGALQDYGRAVVVGDTTTFGKGTVQTITPLAPLMDRAGLGHSFDPGALKVTISKFYRPSGGSTELKGVSSDIVLPSPSEVAGVSESMLTDPLPWDTVPAVKYDKDNQVAPYLPALRAQSAKRVAADKAFSTLREEIAQLKKRVADKTVSLNEAERRKEMATAKARQEQLDAAARTTANARVTYPITVKNADSQGLPEPMKPAVKPAPDAGASSPEAKEDRENQRNGDVVSNESLMIMRDYARLLEKPRPRT